MHLRSAETLITQQSLRQLSQEIERQLDPEDHVIFAGSMPEGTLQDKCISLITNVGLQCSGLTVDTSGNALGKIINQGNIDVIKPNLKELSELLGRTVENDIEKIVSAARQLSGCVKVVIVSLGREGAVAVTEETAVYCRLKNHHHRIVHTVACGDYLLAGYMSVPHFSDIGQKLIIGIKSATAKAWGWAGIKPWLDVQKDIDVEITQL
jgi:fructose-1-phosphate kinase PfkB-like protein